MGKRDWLIDLRLPGPKMIGNALARALDPEDKLEVKQAAIEALHVLDEKRYAHNRSTEQVSAEDPTNMAYLRAYDECKHAAKLTATISLDHDPRGGFHSEYDQALGEAYALAAKVFANRLSSG